MHDPVFELKTTSWRRVRGVNNSEFFEPKSLFRRRSGTIRVDALVRCFLSATDEQRSQMIANITLPDQLWRLVRLIAHTGTLIKSPSDISWFRLSLGIAALEGGRYDFRDTITALIVPRYGAERVAIETAPVFDEMQAICSPRARDILGTVRSYSTEQLADFVKRSGPAMWLSDFTDAMVKVRVTRSGELFMNEEIVSFDELKQELERLRHASGIAFCHYEEPSFAKCPMSRQVFEALDMPETDDRGRSRRITVRRFEDASYLDWG